MGLAFGASLMLGLALALLLEFLDKGFRNAEQLERQFGAPVLGMVPLVRYRSTGKRHPSSFALANPFSAYAETVRSIYTALRFSQIDRPPRILRSEEHTSELQSLMRISYAVFCLKKTKIMLTSN